MVAETGEVRGKVSTKRACYYLISAAGYPNYGDELITAGWLRHLAVTAPDADVWLDCQSPGTAQLLVGGLHPRLRIVDTLWRLCREAPEHEPWRLAAWVQRAVVDPGQAPRLVAGLEQLVRADVVHLLGGGYLAGLWPAHIGLVAGAAAAARAGGATAVATGQGLCPAAPGTAELLGALLRSFAVVDVRDEPSAALLAGAGVGHAVLTCDDAFLAVARPADAPSGNTRDGNGNDAPPDRAHPAYMVCAQSDASQVEPARLAGRILDTLRRWGAAAEQVGFVEGVPGADREVYGLIEHQLPGARFYPFSELWRDGLPIGAHQAWISTRFHFHLLAAAGGARGLAVSVHPAYYQVKHRSLIEAGSGWTVAGTATDPVPAEATGGFEPSRLAQLHDRKLALAATVYPPARLPAWTIGAQRDRRARRAAFRA